MWIVGHSFDMNMQCNTQTKDKWGFIFRRIIEVLHKE